MSTRSDGSPSPTHGAVPVDGAAPGDDFPAAGGGHPTQRELLDFYTARAEGTLIERMGIVFTEADEKRVVATMPVEGNTQPIGLLHGGAHLVLAETLGSMGAAFVAGPDKVVLGIEINASHVRGIGTGAGLVTGTAEVLRAGRTLITHEITMTDERGRLLSVVRMTNLVRDAPKGPA